MPDETIEITRYYKVGKANINKANIFPTDGDTNPVDVVFPSNINGLPVTSIGVSYNGPSLLWASDTVNVRKITIPEGVKVINKGAFSSSSLLKYVDIPDSVETIGDSAFYCCDALEEVRLPKGISKISKDMFMRCPKLQRVSIPDSVQTIEECAFAYCTSLSSVVIPDGVKKIDCYAFLGCTNLESVFIPESVTYIDSQAFNSDKLTIYCYPNTTAYNYARNRGLNYKVITTYPTGIKYTYNEQYHQLKFTWEPIADVQQYGVAIYLAGKWRVQTQDIPASTTSYTTPKNSVYPGSTYKVAIVAKVNGKWDTTNAIKNAVTVKITATPDPVEAVTIPDPVEAVTITDTFIDDSGSISGNNPSEPSLSEPIFRETYDYYVKKFKLRSGTTPVSREDENGPVKNELIFTRTRKYDKTDAEFSLTPSRNSYYAFTITDTNETKFGDYKSTVKIYYKTGFINNEEEQVEPEEITPSVDGSKITYVFALEEGIEYSIYVNNPTNNHTGEYELHVSEDNWVYAPNGGLWTISKYSTSSVISGNLVEERLYIPSHRIVSSIIELTGGTEVVVDPNGDVESQIREVLNANGMLVTEDELQSAITAIAGATASILILFVPVPGGKVSGGKKLVRLVLSAIINYSTYGGLPSSIQTLENYLEQYSFKNAYEEGYTNVYSSKTIGIGRNWNPWSTAPYIYKITPMGDVGKVNTNISDSDIISWCEWKVKDPA